MENPTLIEVMTIFFISVGSYGAIQLEPMEQNRTKVLLIYETEDEEIQQKALSFRQRLSSEDIAQVTIKNTTNIMVLNIIF